MPRRMERGPVLLVLAIAVAISLPHWFEPVHWSDPDSLFYQAKTLGFRGQDEHRALRRVFSSPIADRIHSYERKRRPANRKYTSAHWIDYTNRFYRRRLVVSLIAAGVYPAFGERSLLNVSLLGYVLLGPALYLLLRRRFSSAISVAVTVICLLAPPLRQNSFVPMTDSWGLLLETCALLAAVLVMDRGAGWVAAWVAAIAVLSLTRDATIVPVVAALGLVVLQRNRRALLLATTGFAAALPAPLILGNTSLRENLAFVFSGYKPPQDGSWSFVLDGYWPHLRHLVRLDLTKAPAPYGTHLGWQTPFWYLGLALAIIGVVLLITKLVTDRDPYFQLLGCSLLGGAILVAAFDDYSVLRQEIVFIPPIAVGLALLAERATGASAARSRKVNRMSAAAARYSLRP